MHQLWAGVINQYQCQSVPTDKGAKLSPAIIPCWENQKSPSSSYQNPFSPSSSHIHHYNHKSPSTRELKLRLWFDLQNVHSKLGNWNLFYSSAEDRDHLGGNVDLDKEEDQQCDYDEIGPVAGLGWCPPGFGIPHLDSTKLPGFSDQFLIIINFFFFIISILSGLVLFLYCGDVNKMWLGGNSQDDITIPLPCKWGRPSVHPAELICNEHRSTFDDTTLNTR